MTASTPLRSWSPCQSATGSPPASRTARRASTSSSEPGKVTTPIFIPGSRVLDADGKVLDDRVRQQCLGDLADLGQRRLVGFGDLELEPLALADVENPVESEPGQCAMHSLALRVEDLRLGHHFDDDARHTAILLTRDGA